MGSHGISQPTVHFSVHKVTFWSGVSSCTQSRAALCFTAFHAIIKWTVTQTIWKVSVCSFRPAPFSSYGLDIDEVAVLGPLPQALDPLQLAAVKLEARPGGQLEQGAGDRHEHQHVEAAQTQRRSPWAGGNFRHRNQRILHRLPLKNVITLGEEKKVLPSAYAKPR